MLTKQSSITLHKIIVDLMVYETVHISKEQIEHIIDDLQKRKDIEIIDYFDFWRISMIDKHIDALIKKFSIQSIDSSYSIYKYVDNLSSLVFTITEVTGYTPQLLVRNSKHDVIEQVDLFYEQEGLVNIVKLNYQEIKEVINRYTIYF